MKTVFIILLFLVPGLLIKTYQNYMSVLKDENDAQKTIYEQMFQIVAHSLIVTTFTIAAIDLIDMIQFRKLIIIKISDLLARLDIISFCITYLIVCILATLFWKCLYEEIVKEWLHEKRNKILDEKHGVESVSKDDPTVWEDIFFNPEITKEHMFVSIYKDGAYITSGEIRGYNEGRNLKREFEIRYSYEVEKVIEMDKKKSDEEKWLHYVDYEYFDLETGILIKFYDPRRIVEHWKEI